MTTSEKRMHDSRNMVGLIVMYPCATRVIETRPRCMANRVGDARHQPPRLGDGTFDRSAEGCKEWHCGAFARRRCDGWNGLTEYWGLLLSKNNRRYSWNRPEVDVLPQRVLAVLCNNKIEDFQKITFLFHFWFLISEFCVFPCIFFFQWYFQSTWYAIVDLLQNENFCTLTVRQYVTAWNLFYFFPSVGSRVVYIP